MARQDINIGSSENRGDGDTLRNAMEKVNNNFVELYDNLITGGSDIDDVVAPLFLHDGHTNVVATRDDSANRIILSVDFQSVADIKGSIFGDDSTLLVDGVNSSIPYSVLSDAPVIPTVPTLVSAFTNDAGYISTAAAPIETIAGTTYTVALGDVSKYKETTNAAAVTITVDGTTGFSAGDEIFFEQGGAGVITFAIAGGVTINSRGGVLSTAGQYATAFLKFKSATVATLSGDLA